MGLFLSLDERYDQFKGEISRLTKEAEREARKARFDIDEETSEARKAYREGRYPDAKRHLQRAAGFKRFESLYEKAALYYRDCLATATISNFNARAERFQEQQAELTAMVNGNESLAEVQKRARDYQKAQFMGLKRVELVREAANDVKAHEDEALASEETDDQDDYVTLMMQSFADEERLRDEEERARVQQQSNRKSTSILRNSNTAKKLAK